MKNSKISKENGMSIQNETSQLRGSIIDSFSATLATGLCTIIFFPLETWRTRKQAEMAGSTKSLTT
jgi:hypothetical protein